MQGHSTVRMDIPENYEAIFSFIFGSILSHIPLSQKRESLFDCVFVLIN